MKKVAIFDIDGTVFRSSLLIELTDALIQEGIFHSKVNRLYARAYENWLNRKGPYEEYIDAVVKTFRQNIRGVRYNEFSKIAKKVATFHRNRIYRYPRDVIKNLKKKNYYLLAISHSPQKVVKEFCEKMSFDKIYGQIYEIDRQKKFTGRVLYTELISDKGEILKRAVEKEGLTLKGSVGVGDTESDIAFLKMVEKPICFNPNQKLFQYAKRAGWKIVVERKDVIYHF
ncbi:HAD-IB family phosphatase, partial [Patescibacteria group bacterium]|nr:HAD-IB family phosphatase [Patescibacteria group bacterium]